MSFPGFSRLITEERFVGNSEQFTDETAGDGLPGPARKVQGFKKQKSEQSQLSRSSRKPGLELSLPAFSRLITEERFVGNFAQVERCWST